MPARHRYMYGAIKVHVLKGGEYIVHVGLRIDGADCKTSMDLRISIKNINGFVDLARTIMVDHGSVLNWILDSDHFDVQIVNSKSGKLLLQIFHIWPLTFVYR